MLAIVRKNPVSGHHSLHATENLAQGQILTSFSHSEMLDKPSRFTLQISADRHIMLAPAELLYTNHSCAPNLFFDTEKMDLVLLRDVQAGEELCFFYPSTEWLMAEPFHCRCGAPDCLGIISGASVLGDEVLSRCRLTAFIRQKWLERIRQKQ